MSTAILTYTDEQIDSLYREKCKTELQLKRASAELSYANALLDSYNLNLFVAERPGCLDIINMLREELELGVGSDIINELTAKENEQEDRRNKCYAIWDEIDTRYTRQTASYYDAVDTRNNERSEDEEEDREYEEDSDEYDCSYCGKNARECGEDHDDEMREIEYSRRRDVWL